MTGLERATSGPAHSQGPGIWPVQQPSLPERPASPLIGGQAVTRLDGHPAKTRLASVDDPVRPDLHPGTEALPGLTRVIAIA